MKKKGILKTILINIGIFLGLLILLDIIIISGWETRRFINYLKEDVFNTKAELLDARAFLPNYKDASWAKEYFNDFNTLKNDNYKSYIGWRKKKYESKYINIDSSGIRITPQPELKDSIIKYVFLGGSTMWGTGAPDNGTIPAFFAEIGNGLYDVKNFGESGYRAFQSYIYLMLQFNKGLKTDWVITYDGVNEAVGYLQSNEPVSTYAESRMREKLQKKDGLSKTVTDLTYKNFFLGPVLNTVNRIKNKRVVIPKEKIILNEKRTDEVARTLLDAWSAMNDLSEKNNAHFLAVLQPNVAVGSPNKSYLEFDEYQNLMIQTYGQLYDHVRKLLQEDIKYYKLRNKVLDLTYSLDGEEKYYIDWCHVSPNGNKVIAEKISERVINK